MIVLVEDNFSEVLLVGEFKDGDIVFLDVDEIGNLKVICYEKFDVCDYGLCLFVLKIVIVLLFLD